MCECAKIFKQKNVEKFGSFNIFHYFCNYKQPKLRNCRSKMNILLYKASSKNTPKTTIMPILSALRILPDMLRMQFDLTYNSLAIDKRGKKRIASCL